LIAWIGAALNIIAPSIAPQVPREPVPNLGENWPSPLRSKDQTSLAIVTLAGGLLAP
jgi:hypothetical protein